MLDKHGWSRTSKVMYSLVIGIICFLLGMMPLLNNYIGFFPEISITITEAALFIAGMLLLYDSFSVGYGMSKIMSIVIAVLLAVLGAIPLLIRFNILNFLPFFATLSVNPVILQIVLACYGAYLVFDAYIIRRHYY